MYIDWLTIQQDNSNGYFSPVSDGTVVKYDPQENPVWQTACGYQHKGSYESSARIKIDERSASLSFNPSRFNRPDNVSGVTWDEAINIANSIMAEFGQNPFQAAPTKSSNGLVLFPGATITRIDVCENYKTGTHCNAQTYIRALSQTRISRNTTSRKGDTVYFNKGSERKTLKAYIKGPEILSRTKHLTDYRLHLGNELTEYGIIRLEAKYSAKELRRHNLRNLASITHQKLEAHFMADKDKMKHEVHEENLDSLTQNEIGILRMWQSGDNVRDYIKSSAFYKHRKNIKLKTGYDIAADNIIGFNPKQKIIYLSPFLDEHIKTRPENYSHELINAKAKASI